MAALEEKLKNVFPEGRKQHVWREMGGEGVSHTGEKGSFPFKFHHHIGVAWE